MKDVKHQLFLKIIHAKILIYCSGEDLLNTEVEVERCPWLLRQFPFFILLVVFCSL